MIVEGIKKFFLLIVLFVIAGNIKNVYASYADYITLGGCAIPGLAVCAMKMTNHKSDLVQFGPDIKTQAAMVLISFGVNCALLTYKKNILNKTEKDNYILTAQRNMPCTVFFAGFGELVVPYLVQCAVLYRQNSLTVKAISYAGLTTLINIVPAICYILSTKNGQKTR